MYDKDIVRLRRKWSVGSSIEKSEIDYYNMAHL